MMTVELCFGTTLHIFRSLSYSVVHGWHMCVWFGDDAQLSSEHEEG